VLRADGGMRIFQSVDCVNIGWTAPETAWAGLLHLERWWVGSSSSLLPWVAWVAWVAPGPSRDGEGSPARGVVGTEVVGGP
jgi:hypothetical protein